MSAKILIIEDNETVRENLSTLAREWGYRAVASEDGKGYLNLIKTVSPDLVLLDLKLPEAHGMEILREIKRFDKTIVVIVITGFGDVQSAVEAMKIGAVHYLTKPFDTDELRVVIRNSLENQRTQRALTDIVERKRSRFDPGNFIFTSRIMQRVLDDVMRVAGVPTTSVLIEGETGTGKELIGKIIHFNSPRANEPFVALNCSAIPDNLLESELFGHEKGAFTDARHTKKGLFEIADGGTIFLDEIGDMSLKLQPKILRVMEDGCFRRLGGTGDVVVNTRIIASTNKNLKAMVRENTFRKDLYYRLCVVPLKLPPLRNRKADILPLAEHFLEHFSKELKKQEPGIAAEVKQKLLSYPWPGNVR
ncbi:MAG: sigma-54 dependent transcriptional regulator, partial [Thermodesulfobacteriota bacterium]